MIKWLIIIGGVLVVVGLIVLLVFIAKRNGKKTGIKLDNTIKLLKEERDTLEKKEQAQAEEQKEKDAFAKITLTEDVEDEFADIFSQGAMQSMSETAKEKELKTPPKFDEIFKNVPKKFSNKQSKREEGDFDDFLNQHSYTRRVLDEDLLAEIRKLPPKIKAIVLGNVFNKIED